MLSIVSNVSISTIMLSATTKSKLTIIAYDTENGEEAMDLLRYILFPQ